MARKELQLSDITPIKAIPDDGGKGVVLPSPFHDSGFHDSFLSTPSNSMRVSHRTDSMIHSDYGSFDASKHETELKAYEQMVQSSKWTTAIANTPDGFHWIGSHMGMRHLDVISNLGTSYEPCFQHVLGFLSPKDVLRMGRVCQKWRRLAKLYRGKLFTELFETMADSKENESLHTKSQCHMTMSSTPLQPVQLRAKLHTAPLPLHKTHFEQYIEEGNKLLNDESLRKCPRCCRPAKASPVEEKATCVSIHCQYVFCIKCLCPFHGAAPCHSLTTPISPKKRAMKSQSRRNLRRL